MPTSCCSAIPTRLPRTHGHALLMLKYDNWAGLDEIEARAGEFYLEHYGAKRLKALGEEREAMREVLSNRAVRGVPLTRSEARSEDR